MKLAEYTVRMKDERLPKRSETKNNEVAENEEDLKKAEKEEKWREKANNRV